MRILFLSDNFPPEYNAPASRTFEHCKQWIALGADVAVITCVPNFPTGIIYPGFKNKLYQKETVQGITVIRVWSYITPNLGVFRRTLDFVSFSLASFFFGLFTKCDIIVATSPQFFTAISGCALGVLRRKPWVMEVRDIWPESIIAVGVTKLNWAIPLLEKIELSLYRLASRVVVVTDSFKENLVRRGVPQAKIEVIKNGVDLTVYRPQPKDQNLLEQLRVQGKFIIGYLGTHGLAHSLDFIIRSIAKENDATNHFLFIGDGAEKRNVVELAQKLGLENISFIDPVKKSDIASYLSILDLSLVPLRKSSTFESVIPSKIFESVAMNIPILLGVDGETRRIVEQYRSGVFFEPENESEFLAKLRLMKANIQADKDFYSVGCQKMASEFDRKNLAKKMLEALSLCIK